MLLGKFPFPCIVLIEGAQYILLCFRKPLFSTTCPDDADISGWFPLGKFFGTVATCLGFFDPGIESTGANCGSSNGRCGREFTTLAIPGRSHRPSRRHVNSSWTLDIGPLTSNDNEFHDSLSVRLLRCSFHFYKSIDLAVCGKKQNHPLLSVVPHKDNLLIR